MNGTIYHNKIQYYDAWFNPRPVSHMYTGSMRMHAVQERFYPNDPNVFHFTRLKYNDGFGVSKLIGLWDAITKLRNISHADYHRSLVFMILEYPESWNEENGKRLEALIRRLSWTMKLVIIPSNVVKIIAFKIRKNISILSKLRFT